MRMMKILMMAWAAILIGATGANAYPISYTLTGDLTGSLVNGGVPATFVGAPFVWTVTSDSTLGSVVLTHGGPTPEFSALTDTLEVGGMTLVPSIPTVFAVASVPPIPPNPGFGIGGFVDTTALMGLAWHADALFGYSGKTGVGPLAVVFDNEGPLPTNDGTLNISTSTDNLVFSARVDEPSGLALMASGLLGCLVTGGVARRRRR